MMKPVIVIGSTSSKKVTEDVLTFLNLYRINIINVGSAIDKIRDWVLSRNCIGIKISGVEIINSSREITYITINNYAKIKFNPNKKYIFNFNENYNSNIVIKVLKNFLIKKIKN